MKSIVFVSSAVAISGPFDASIKKAKIGDIKKGSVVALSQSNQTKEEVIFSKINMEQILSLEIGLEMLKFTKI